MQQIWALVLPLPFTGCVVLGNSSHISKPSVQTGAPQLPWCWMGQHIRGLHRWLINVHPVGLLPEVGIMHLMGFRSLLSGRAPSLGS